jgi:hypothetical protein
MKFSELLDRQNSIAKLSSMTELPMSVKLRVAREMEKITKELKFFESARLEILKKYGREKADRRGTYEFKYIEKDPNGNEVEINNVDAADAELKSLLDEEAKAEVKPIVLISEIPDKNTLSAADLQSLVGFLITDDGAVKKDKAND